MPTGLSAGKLVTVIALAALATPACKTNREQTAWWENERERIELEQQLNLAAYRCGRAGPGNPGELATLVANLRNSKLRQQALLQTRASLRDEIVRLEHQCDEMAEQAVQARRMALIGTKFETLRLNATRVFHHVTLTGIDDGGVSISHDHGAARLGYADLSPEQRDFFGLDEGAAIAAANRESQQSLAYEQWLAQGLKTALDNQQLASATAIKQDEAASKARSLMLEQEAARNRLRPLAQPARRLQGTIRPFVWTYPHGPGYPLYRSRYRYVYD